MATLDTLDIKISANAVSAAKALDTLAASMKRVRSALMNTKNDVSVGDKLSKSISDLNKSLAQINTHSIKKLNQLSDALSNFATAAKNAKGVSISSSLKRSVKNVQDALTVKSDTTTSSGESATVAFASQAKGIHKLGEEYKQIKAKIAEVTKQAKEGRSAFGNFFKAIGRIALYRAIRTAIKAVSEAFSEGLKNAYMYSKQSETFTRLADTMDRIKSITAQMINQLGAFWGEVKQLVLPAIEWIVEKVRLIAKNLTELFAALNGEDTYLVARYQALEWEEATENVKKYKQQLLGLDELNNLTTPQKSGKEETDYSQLYDEFKVSDKLQAIGASWGSVVTTIKGYVEELGLFLTGAEIAMGAILLFSGVNIPLGLGLLAHGVWNVGEKIGIWDSTQKNIEATLSDIEELLGGAMAAVGAVLLFSGVAPQWGLGLIIAGISLFDKAKKRKTNWSKVDENTKGALDNLNKTFGIFLGVVGGVLLFSGANIGLGLGCLIAGISMITSTKEKKYSWDKVDGKLTKAFKTIKESLIAPIGLAAVGLALLFTGHFGLGLGMLLSSKMLAEYQIQEFGWDSVLKKLKIAWASITAYVKTTIKYDINSFMNWVEEKLGVDVNGDGKVAGLATTAPKVVGVGTQNTLDFFDVPDEPTIQTPTANSLAIQNLEKTLYDSGYTNPTTGDSSLTIQGALGNAAAKWTKKVLKENIGLTTWVDTFNDKIQAELDKQPQPKAQGGIVNGSLFWAGEQGPEFVGAMGSSSAVANTGQMTEAIYKAAYMGMSKALQENGGNGLAGFVPATTDDLFIAMRKKASNYNKRTGSSAFA